MTEPDAVPAIPEPTQPARLPFGLSADALREWREHLDSLSEEEAVRIIRDDIKAIRLLSRYYVGVRAVFCGRMYLAGAPLRTISKAAGVADSYVSRRAREFGLPLRTIRTRRR